MKFSTTTQWFVSLYFYENYGFTNSVYVILKYYGTANQVMYMISPGVSLWRWFMYVMVRLLGGSLLSMLDSYVCMLTIYVMMMIMGYAVQYVCFTKKKYFVRFLVSLTEPVAHKNYIQCCRYRKSFSCVRGRRSRKSKKLKAYGSDPNK